MEQKEMEQKMKAYVKTGRKAGRGSKRAKRKLRKMAENDLITVISKKATNHPAWYTKLGGDLIGLNYGMIDQINSRSDLIVDHGGYKVNVRTTVDVIIDIALTAPSDDSLRVAAQKIINELRLVSGANTIYDVDDMIDFLLNVRSIWVGLMQGRRAIQCINATDPYDIDAWRKYLMMALYDVQTGGLTPSGFPEEFRQNAANTVNWLNTMVKAVRFMMPINLSLFERTEWMFSHLFADGTGKKFGTKMFVAREVPYYTHSGAAHTAVTYQLFGATGSLVNYKSSIEKMVSDFTTQLANVAIAGDLMKAYGMAAFFDPGVIDYTEKPKFIYDERALEQIANADVAGDFRTTGTYTYGVANTPSYKMTFPTPLFQAKQVYAKTSTLQVKFVNTEDNEIEAGETLSLTRLKATVEPKFNTASPPLVTDFEVVSCGTEVVVDYLYVHGISAVGNNAILGITNWSYADNTWDNLKTFASDWSIDDYGPMVLTYLSGYNPGSAIWATDVIFDFSNWAILSRTQQDQLHKTAVLSLLTPSASVIQQAVARL